ncbi:MAG: hypothetical protein ACFNVX_11000 [Lachnoanaerobaculum saburreum]
MNIRSIIKKFLAFFLPVAGAIYLSAYIRSAVLDVVYTDYIRIINTYLYHPFSPALYFRKDALTRLPVTFFERMINVKFFKYSTMFDMSLGIIFLAMMGIVIGIFMAKKDLKIRYIILVMMLVFSLSQWEMLTNGTGWVHFFTFFLFVLHFYILDLYVQRETAVKLFLNIFLPVFTIIMAAGSYSLAYGATLICAYIFYYVYRKKKIGLSMCIPVVTVLVIFMYSYINSDTVNAGATSESIVTVFSRDPLYFLYFGLNTFASDIVSVELVKYFDINTVKTGVLGAVVIVFYMYALYLNFKHRIYENTIFPLLLLISGLFSHVMVILTRWIFLDRMYAMSSRYSLQFGAGLIGVILTFACMKLGGNKSKFSLVSKLVIPVFVLLVFAGNVSTAGNEMRMAKYRMESFETKMKVAKNFEHESDETLKTVLQYHSPKKIREALRLIKSKKLNIFSE